MTPIVLASIMRPHGETGVQAHTQAFLAYLQRAGRPAELLTPYDAPPWLVYPVFGLRRALTPLSRAASTWWYRHWHAFFVRLALARRLGNGDPCIVYAQCPLSARAALDVRVSASQRVVMAVHYNVSQAEEWAGKGMIAHDGRMYRAIRALESGLLPRLDGLVSVSAFMRATLLREIPAIASVPHAVIPNFLADPAGLDGAPGLQPGRGGLDAVIDVRLPAGQPTGEAPGADLISIGTLEARKNHAYLLDILACAHRQGARLTLTLAGDGPERDALQRQANALGLGRHVHFLGFVANAAHLMPGHRAYIQTARLENFPVTLVEALAYGLPVLAPAVGGIPEVFDDGVEGCRIPLDDAAIAARLLVELLSDRLRWQDMSRAARLRFTSHFTAPDVAARLERFLREDCDRSRAAAAQHASHAC